VGRGFRFARQAGVSHSSVGALVSRPLRSSARLLRGRSLEFAKRWPKACAILGPLMPDESTTPDLVELVRRSIEAESAEVAVSFYAPETVWDASPWGMGVFEGKAAVRDFFEDWAASYTDMEWEAEEIRDLGNAVTFAVIVQQGRVVGSSSSVQLRYGSVAEWRDGLILRNTTYTDIDDARAAAERLAEERG
jgi:ketosteroid isomerase-like protein